MCFSPSVARCESLERRSHLAVTYTLSAPRPYSAWANTWTSKFVKTTRDYTGSDGINSIPLNGNETLGSAYNTPGWELYTTGDAFLGSYSPTTGQRVSTTNEPTKFVHNVSLLHNTNGATPTSPIAHWRNPLAINTDPLTMATIPGPTADTTRTHFYWPADGTVVTLADGTRQLVQLAGRFRANSTFVDELGVAVIASSLAGYQIDQNNWPYAKPHGVTPAPSWFNSDNVSGLGSARNVFQADNPNESFFTSARTATGTILNPTNGDPNGYVYVYGVQNGVGTGFGLPYRYGFVARALAKNLSNSTSWQYYSYANNAWMSNSGSVDAIAQATPMRDVKGNNVNDVAAEFSVTKLQDNRYAMVYTPFGVGNQINVRYAANPQGPWSASQNLLTIPTPTTGNPTIGLRAIPPGFSGWSYWTYGAKAHAQLSLAPSGRTAGKLLVSYFLGTVNGGGATSILGPDFSYGDIYRPRFVEFSINSTTSVGTPSATAIATVPSSPRAHTGRLVKAVFGDEEIDSHDRLL